MVVFDRYKWIALKSTGWALIHFMHLINAWNMEHMKSFTMFALVFPSFWLPADSSLMLVFQWIHPTSSEYDWPILLSHYNLLKYTLLFSSVPQCGITYYLKPSYAHYIFTNISYQIFVIVIWVVTFHALHLTAVLI